MIKRKPHKDFETLWGFMIFVLGAVGGTRTHTALGHRPLKTACLPVPPPRQGDGVYTDSPGLASIFLAMGELFFRAPETVGGCPETDQRPPFLYAIYSRISPVRMSGRQSAMPMVTKPKAR